MTSTGTLGWHRSLLQSRQQRWDTVSIRICRSLRSVCAHPQRRPREESLAESRYMLGSSSRKPVGEFISSVFSWWHARIPTGDLHFLFQMFRWIANEMNVSYMSSNSSSLVTSTLISRGTTSRIPHREQVLIDAFNTYIQIGIGSILFLFGLTFNCLSLIYFRASRSFRHTTFQLYFSIIAILDTVRLFEFFIFILFDKGYLRVTLQLCRWVFFTIMFTGQVMTSLTVWFSRQETFAAFMIEQFILPHAHADRMYIKVTHNFRSLAGDSCSRQSDRPLRFLLCSTSI